MGGLVGVRASRAVVSEMDEIRMVTSRFQGVWRKSAAHELADPPAFPILRASMTMTFANRVCELRKANGLTQQQLAVRCGLTLGQISRFENGLRPSLEAIVHVARGLGVNAIDLASLVCAQLERELPSQAQDVIRAQE
jgi:DNA-binding XRE family transcriptional regulator